MKVISTYVKFKLRQHYRVIKQNYKLTHLSFNITQQNSEEIQDISYTSNSSTTPQEEVELDRI